MKRLAVALAALLAGVALWALWPDASGDATGAAPAERADAARQAPRARPARPEPRRGRVAGRVLRDGQPAADARVTLRGAVPLVTTTLDDGAFLFDDVPPGMLYVSASSADAASEVLGPLQLAEGGRIDGVALTLMPAVSVQGRVIDLVTRQPVVGAIVVSASKMTRTDEAGAFTLDGPRAQTWLDVSAPGFLPRTEWVSLELARAGGRLELVLTPAGRVEGHVLEMGDPVANATVRAEVSDGLQRGERTPTVFTDAKGHFALDAPAGAMVVVAVTPGGLRVTSPLLRLTVGEHKDGVVLEVGDATGASGHVLRDGKPVPGAQLAAVDAASEEVAAWATSGPDGSFRFEALRAGRYLVQVRLAGGFVALAGPFLQGGDGAPWNVDVHAGLALDGRVEPPSAGVRVRWRSGAWAGPAAETVTDASGAFHFDGLPDELVSLDAEGPSGAATARARAGDTVVLTLRKGHVVVRLTDDGGGPVTDGVLTARSVDTGAVQQHLVLAPDGVMRLDLPIGPWELWLEVAGRGRSPPVQVTVTEAGAEVRLSIESSVTVRGTVVDAATRLPLQGARIEGFSGPIGRWSRLGVMSDARGAFVLPPLPRSARLVVSRDGYAQQWRAAASGDFWDVALQATPGTAQRPENVQFEGVGMVLEPAGDLVRVTQVNEGSPAERGGVQPGDLIVGVDGASASGLGLRAIVDRIRGPAGTPVRITFERQGQRIDLTLRRRLLTL